MLRQLRFKLLVERIVARHQPRSSSAGAIAPRRLNSRFDNGGMRAQPEIIIVAERQQRLAAPYGGSIDEPLCRRQLPPQATAFEQAAA